MELIGTDALRKDAAKHGDTDRAIESWIRTVESAEWSNIEQVKQIYRATDYVKGKTVFNIKGNSYRLITIIDYSLQLVVYETILTHAEYDKYKF
jgi:mRNA interferase HigB